MKYHNILVFMLFIQFGYSQIKTKPITEVSQNDIQNVTLLDVRTPEEFEEGHLPNALNINLFDENFVAQVNSRVSKDKKVFVYCKSGRRSAKASKKIDSLGFSVVDLLGGYLAFKKAIEEEK
ncbi:rhodanese-like domain-containing protein [Cellulophaga baltica]|uniref:rhodanese-like domain-containing protein n=1 Tax=Cellulophaga TaxID=104264 RepID=UPI001C073153|nr:MULTISPECIES: rhodanese-like domain-containing protein [Cellulophaga]MBU2997152.1 rhodanese-like domain-containing protein [Cellulophaga baltica]MDO6768550.1 rhodanese-like domain-containing protein [Cellulophaga sp. 1_MG-2023]